MFKLASSEFHVNCHQIPSQFVRLLLSILVTALQPVDPIEINQDWTSWCVETRKKLICSSGIYIEEKFEFGVVSNHVQGILGTGFEDDIDLLRTITGVDLSHLLTHETLVVRVLKIYKHYYLLDEISPGHFWLSCSYYHLQFL